MKTKLSMKNVFGFVVETPKLGVKTPRLGVKTPRLGVSTRLLFLILALSPMPCALSQIPQGFNYQAIARDGTGNPIMNTALPVMITVQADSLGTAILWQELHSSVTSNGFGMINLVIGRGTKQATSTVGAFSDIDWSITPKFIKTEIDYSGWKTMGVSRLWSVPYAMVAEDLAGTVPKLSVKGGTGTGFEDALFEVKNKNGQTIFAVYNEGVRIYVDDGAKGPKGGFAVGGFDMTKATKREYFVVSDDSVRIYLDSNPLTKGKKSGFAVGGYDMTKGTIQNYLDVSADSVRVYIDSNPATKKVKGGFAVGGYDMTKKVPQDILRVTYDSTRIYINDTPGKAVKSGFAVGGYDASKALKPQYLSVKPYQTNVQVNDSLKGFSVTNIQGGTAADFMNINKLNYSIGHESGLKTNPNISIIKGKYNVFFGYKAGFNNIEGYGNIFVGHLAGFNSTIGGYNVYMGFRAGNANINGNSNVFIGYESGSASTAGWNLYVGQGAGKANSIGTQNTYLGCQAGIDDGVYYTEYGLVPGSGNTFVGFRAGANSSSGNNNVYIGTRAGELNNNYRSGRVFIGYMAGYNDGYDNRLYIDNSNTSAPLIFGDFTDGSEKLVVNGSFNYGTDAGTSNAYVVTIPSVSAYIAGMMVTFKANTANTAGACTLKINSLTDKSLYMKRDQNPTANYIEAGSIVMAVYDGTSFQMLQPAAN